jgi:hypothetical protein
LLSLGIANYSERLEKMAKFTLQNGKQKALELLTLKKGSPHLSKQFNHYYLTR